MKKENVLVTGGSGFIGSHVADLLTERGYNVRIFDIEKSPYLQPGQEMYVGDLLELSDVKNALSGIDYVFHFAGIADIDECAQRPVDTVKYNILGTTYLLDESVKANIQRFFFASSAYVYSDAGYFYRSSKQACENLIENYADLYDLKYTTLRYGSLYGSRSGITNSIYKLLQQAVEENKLTYYGTGDELREFIHVHDAAEITVNCMDKEFENSRLTITGYEKMRYKDLLHMIKEILSNKVDIEIKKSKREAHYKITPYNFNPKLGKKIVNTSQIDLGQGLMQLIEEIYKSKCVETL